MGASGVESLIPETGELGLDWIADVDAASGLFFAGAWLIVFMGFQGIVAFLGIYNVLRGAGVVMVPAPVLGTVRLTLVTVSHLLPISLAYELVLSYSGVEPAVLATSGATFDTFTATALVTNCAGNFRGWGCPTPSCHLRLTAALDLLRGRFLIRRQRTDLVALRAGDDNDCASKAKRTGQARERAQDEDLAVCARAGGVREWGGPVHESGSAVDELRAGLDASERDSGEEPAHREGQGREAGQEERETERASTREGLTVGRRLHCRDRHDLDRRPGHARAVATSTDEARQLRRPVLAARSLSTATTEAKCVIAPQTACRSYAVAAWIRAKSSRSGLT